MQDSARQQPPWVTLSFGSLKAYLFTERDAHLKISSSLCNVPGQSSGQTDVRVRIDKNLHVQHVQDVLVVEKDIYIIASLLFIL